MTVVNEAALEIVARNVRSARTAAGWSLDALAQRAEVSKGAVVAVEGGRGNPSFATLVRLADALGRSVSSLMEEAKSDPVAVVDVEDVTPLWTGPAGGAARLVLTNSRPTPVEVWRWQLHPGERYDSHPHQTGVTETLTVISGQMHLTVDGVLRPLRAGQTTAFAGDLPHSYEGAGRGRCELLMTVHLPLEH